MSPVEVRPGTAEQLARLAHFAVLDLPEVHELSCVADFLIGDVGPHGEARRLWNRLHDDCLALWHLITADWVEADLDELTDGDWDRHDFPNHDAEVMHRYGLTRNRLTEQIERVVWQARSTAAMSAQPARAAA